MKVLIAGPVDWSPRWEGPEALEAFDMLETVFIHRDRPGVDRTLDELIIARGGSVVRWQGDLMRDHANADLLLLFVRDEADVDAYPDGGLPVRVVVKEAA